MDDLSPNLPEGAGSHPRPSLRTLANRRNALKSTGPKTRAGKRRSALNGRNDLYPAELDRQLRARGEDPREFRRLYRDLAAIFQPADAAGKQAVILMARTWWEKARRIRQWVAAGPARCQEQDALIEQLILFLVNVQRNRHEPWRVRLGAVVGRPIGSPAEVRSKIEARLHLFGAKGTKRQYPQDRRDLLRLERFREVFAETLAIENLARGTPDAAQAAPGPPASGAPEGGEATRSQSG